MNKKRTKLKKDEYKLLNEFFDKLKEKLEKGRTTYGENYNNLNKQKLSKEIEMEVLDIAGWAIMFWMRLKNDKFI